MRAYEMGGACIDVRNARRISVWKPEEKTWKTRNIWRIILEWSF
jgi:hypothetical protein